MTATACIPVSWPAPESVRTLVTTRRGGLSHGVFQANNLAYHVGDNTEHVAANRERLAAMLGPATTIQWLRQVHGTELVDACGQGVPEADGCFAKEPGKACAVLTADCLPLLLCDRNGTQVAAVHAGWRGLAAGILVKAIERFAAEPEDILVYLGPAISQAHFEVGLEVAEAFVQSPIAQSLGGGYQAHAEAAFVPSKTPGHYLADLYSLARCQCKALEVTALYGGEFCTYRDEHQFYSYRRDAVTGRMASLIWLAR